MFRLWVGVLPVHPLHDVGATNRYDEWNWFQLLTFEVFWRQDAHSHTLWPQHLENINIALDLNFQISCHSCFLVSDNWVRASLMAFLCPPKAFEKNFFNVALKLWINSKNKLPHVTSQMQGWEYQEETWAYKFVIVLTISTLPGRVFLIKLIKCFNQSDSSI